MQCEFIEGRGIIIYAENHMEKHLIHEILEKKQVYVGNAILKGGEGITPLLIAFKDKESFKDG